MQSVNSTSEMPSNIDSSEPLNKHANGWPTTPASTTTTTANGSSDYDSDSDEDEVIIITEGDSTLAGKVARAAACSREVMELRRAAIERHDELSEWVDLYLALLMEHAAVVQNPNTPLKLKTEAAERMDSVFVPAFKDATDKGYANMAQLDLKLAEYDAFINGTSDTKPT